MENSNDTMHLFAGAGGGLLADLILGKRPIIAVEWDKYACSVLRARASDGWFPDLSVWEGDVRLFDPSEYAGKVDCIHAGFPCQDISVAGKQSGIGEGTRSGLYREVIRIASIVRPRHIFLENVAAITSKSKDTSKLSAKTSLKSGMTVDGQLYLLPKLALTTKEIDGGCLPDGVNFHHTPNTTGMDGGEQQQEGVEETTRNMAYSSNKGLQGCEITRNNGKDRTQSRYEQFARRSAGNEWNAVESDVGRVANDVADRVGKLKALGNGQVPLQAAVAYSILEELFI